MPVDVSPQPPGYLAPAEFGRPGDAGHPFFAGVPEKYRLRPDRSPGGTWSLGLTIPVRNGVRFPEPARLLAVPPQAGLRLLGGPPAEPHHPLDELRPPR